MDARMRVNARYYNMSKKHCRDIPCSDSSISKSSTKKAGITWSSETNQSENLQGLCCRACDWHSFIAIDNLLCLQIRCGDLYASPAVEEFTKCAVSEKGCVPQRKDNNEYPIPPDRDLVKNFDLRQFQVAQSQIFAVSRCSLKANLPCGKFCGAQKILTSCSHSVIVTFHIFKTLLSSFCSLECVGSSQSLGLSQSLGC